MGSDLTIEKPSLEILIDQNLTDTVRCIATEFYGMYGKLSIHSAMISQEDLELEGLLGATIAYESFDPSLGNVDNVIKAFSTHAYLYIKNAMSTYCHRYGHALSISEKSARRELRSMTDVRVVHINQLENDDFDIPVGSGVETSHDVDNYFLVGFTGFERDLVKDYMLYDYSLEEISMRHKISKTRAGEILRDLKGRMKERAKRYVEND